MVRAIGRALSVAVSWMLGCWCVVGTAHAAEAVDAEPLVLAPEKHAPGVVVYPPRDPGVRRVAVHLHGMCGAPEWECPWLASAFADRAWLVCPRGAVPCEGGGATQGIGHADRDVERAIARVVAHYGDRVDPSAPRILSGFSLGALGAAALLGSTRAEWSEVLLLGANVQLPRRALTTAGVRRVVLGAGAFDMVSTPMQRTTRRLSRAGVDARFMGLGRVGHGFARDMPTWTDEALAWLGAEAD